MVFYIYIGWLFLSCCIIQLLTFPFVLLLFGTLLLRYWYSIRYWHYFWCCCYLCPHHISHCPWWQLFMIWRFIVVWWYCWAVFVDIVVVDTIHLPFVVVVIWYGVVGDDDIVVVVVLVFRPSIPQYLLRPVVIDLSVTDIVARRYIVVCYWYSLHWRNDIVDGKRFCSIIQYYICVVTVIVFIYIVVDHYIDDDQLSQWYCYWPIRGTDGVLGIWSDLIRFIQCSSRSLLLLPWPWLVMTVLRHCCIVWWRWPDRYLTVLISIPLYWILIFIVWVDFHVTRFWLFNSLDFWNFYFTFDLLMTVFGDWHLPLFIVVLVFIVIVFDIQWYCYWYYCCCLFWYLLLLTYIVDGQIFSEGGCC